MKVLVSETSLRNALAKILKEGRETVTFLDKISANDLRSQSDDVVRFLNIAFFNDDSAVRNGDTAAINTQKHGTTYSTALQELDSGSLTGDDLKTIYQLYLASKFGTTVVTPKGQKMSIYDVVGELDGVLFTQGYGTNPSLNDLNRFTLGIARGSPMTAAQQSGEAVPRDPAKEQGTFTYYAEEPTPGEPGTGKVETSTYSEIIDTFVKGVPIPPELSEELDKYREEQLIPIRDSMAIIVDAMLSVGAVKGTTASLSVDLLNADELKDVADQLTKVYEMPVTIGMTASRPPAVTSFALVDACNMNYNNQKSGPGSLVTLVLTSVVLGALGVAYGPAGKLTAPGKILSAKDSKLLALQRSLEDAEAGLSGVRSGPGYDRLVKARLELEAAEAEAADIARQLRTAEEITLASPDVSRVRSSRSSSIEDLRTDVTTKARELATDKRKFTEYIDDYAAYRQALVDAQAEKREAYTAAKEALERAAERRYEASKAAYERAADVATRSGGRRGPAPTLPTAPTPPGDFTPDEIIQKAIGSSDAAEIAEFKRVMKIRLPPEKPPATGTAGLPFTTRPAPTRPAPAVAEPTSPEFDDWVSTVEDFKKQFKEIDTLKNLLRQKESVKTAISSRVDPRLSTTIENAEKAAQEAQAAVNKFKKLMERLDTALPKEASESFMTWIARSVERFEEVHGIRSTITQAAVMTMYIEIVLVALEHMYRIIFSWSPEEQLINQRLDAAAKAGLGSFVPAAKNNALQRLADEVQTGLLAGVRLRTFRREETEKLYEKLAAAISSFAAAAVSSAGVTEKEYSALKAARAKVS
jgi:hypothetical protein